MIRKKKDDKKEKKDDKGSKKMNTIIIVLNCKIISINQFSLRLCLFPRRRLLAS